MVHAERVGVFHLTGHRVVVDVDVAPPAVEELTVRAAGGGAERFVEIMHGHEPEQRAPPVVMERCQRGVAVLLGKETHLRSEEHTSELQSRGHLVCRLLLEKKKKKQIEK